MATNMLSCFLFFYYSMGCSDFDQTCIRIIVLIFISFVCFDILAGAGLTLAVIYQPNELLIGAAIISALSVLCFTAFPIYLIIKLIFCANEKREKTTQNVILLVEMVAGFLTFAAGILYFSAGALLNANPILLPFGAGVSVFGFIMVILPGRCCKRDLTQN